MFGLIVALAIAVLAIPVKQRCGAPGLSCASAVDPQGNVHYYYEVEPLGVYLAEIVVGSNIRVYYASGEDLVKADGKALWEKTCGDTPARPRLPECS